MRRWLLLIMVPLLMLAGVFPARGSAESPVRVEIDGQLVRFPDVQPVIQDGRVLVPIRAVGEGLGASVTWYPSTRTVYLSNVRHTAQISVGSTHAWSDAWMFRLDVPPIILSGRTMLPVRFVAEALGAAVRWDAENRTVVITTREETAYTPLELRQAAAYLTPFVGVDDQGHYTLYRPEGVWLSISPSALRLLRGSMQAINEVFRNVPQNSLVWEPADDLTRLAPERLDLRVGGPDWDGWREPVFAVADPKLPNTQVRVHWWLTKWYIDDDTANEIKWLLIRNSAGEGFGAYILSKFPAAVPYEFGSATASFLLGIQANGLDKCIQRSKGRGVIIFVLYPRNYGWCEAR